jgi:chromosome segregation ATPase
MISIENAKKSIEENKERLEFLCNEEEAYSRWIDDVEEDIEQTKKSLESLEKKLKQLKSYLEDIKDEKIYIRIETLEFKLLIAEGGGLDMLD